MNKYCLYQPNRSSKDIIEKLSRFGKLHYEYRGCLWYIKTPLTKEQVKDILPLCHADDCILQIK